MLQDFVNLTGTVFWELFGEVQVIQKCLLIWKVEKKKSLKYVFLQAQGEGGPGGEEGDDDWGDDDDDLEGHDEL